MPHPDPQNTLRRPFDIEEAKAGIPVVDKYGHAVQLAFFDTLIAVYTPSANDLTECDISGSWGIGMDREPFLFMAAPLPEPTDAECNSYIEKALEGQTIPTIVFDEQGIIADVARFAIKRERELRAELKQARA